MTKFFLQVTIQKYVSAFFKEEQFTYSAVALNETKKRCFNLQQHFSVFFP